MNHITRYIYLPSIIGALLMILVSCTDEHLGIKDSLGANDEDDMVLLAYTFGEDGVDTRALTIYDVKSSVYSKANFNVYVEGYNNDEELKKELTSYNVPSGTDGLLFPVFETRTARWFSRRGTHNIWVWSMPWDNYRYTYQPPVKDEEEGGEENGDGENEEEIPSPAPIIPPVYEIEDEIKIEFKDTDITELTSGGANTFQEGSWANGQDLRLAIAAQYGPSTYAERGQFVPLQFRHLFSAILLGEFNIVDNSTATAVSGLKGNIYLYGLPKEATLYTHPVDNEGNSIRPYVAMPDNFDYPQDKYVKFAIPSNTKAFYNDYNSSVYNTLKSNYYFYAHWFICPEVDLSKLSFKLELYEYDTTNGWRKSNKYGENGAFYGDFSNIQISRTPGNNYDDPDGEDTTVLHAGEYLILGFNISTKGNPSIMGSIVDWNNARQDRSASQYDKDGVYSILEAQDFSSMMNSGDEEKIKEYFGIYGTGEYTSDDPDDPFYDQDLGIFRLYEDIGYTGTGQSDSTGPYAKMNNLYVADGYILDGMGHMVQSRSSSISIGPCRDIYFRSYISSYSTSTGAYSYTEHIVYIDKAGNIWKVDPVTYEQTATGYNITDAKSNPFTLSLSTGKPG